MKNKRWINALIMVMLLVSLSGTLGAAGRGYAGYHIKLHPDVIQGDILGRWSETIMVLEPGASGSWDANAAGRPEVHHDSTQFHMWYTGYNQDTDRYQIGYAVSPDGVNWSK